MPSGNSIGFAPADWMLAILAALFLVTVFAWRPPVQHAFNRFAEKTWICMLTLFVLPIALRLLLLSHHPAPTPDIYDEFSHLLVADTLWHGRLANPSHPMHQFFETFFVLQEPTYSSIYPLGQGIILAFGRLISGSPWAGVLIASGAFCAWCYWMLRAWVAPNWALLGGLLAVAEFGPLCQWTNSYWGGSLAATGGCLVFGALPRIRMYFRKRDAVLLGVGFGIHMLTRQFESVLLFLAAALFYFPWLFNKPQRTRFLKLAGIAVAVAMPIVLLILAQNRAVTHSWLTLPEQLSQYQYGVPAALSIQPNPIPHIPLTPQQETDYKAQALTHGPDGDSWTRFFLRFEYRVRYYRFFFLPPLYVALIAFFFALRDQQIRLAAASLLIFALGTNLFPYLLVHYLAGVTCLFVLMSIAGLEQLCRLRIKGNAVGNEIARALILLCFIQFATWYSLHLFETPNAYSVLRYETWDSINHDNPQRRIVVQRELEGIGGPLLVFVRYSTHHIYQNEWVWNAADIDHSRIIYARDLGPEEDKKLIRYYPNRKILLLDPDGDTPQLTEYEGGNL